MDESLLINNTEKYLKEIEHTTIDLEGIDNFERFKAVYMLFLNRLNRLQSIKEDMDIKGYTSPYRSLTKYGISSQSDPGFEEIAEVNKHGQFFRTKASSKKNLLDRVKSAIDAHKIAIGNLEEYGLIKCEKCGKSYRCSDFLKIGNEKCNCKSDEFTLEIVKNGVYRLEIINNLPLSGNYMVLTSKLNSWGRESFKKILNYLKQEKKGVVKTISAVIKFKRKDRWIRKRINLDSEYTDSYEEKIREDYGKNVRIELLQFHRTKPTIINDKHTRTALSLGYAKCAQDLIEKHEEEILKSKIRDIEVLNEYDTIIKEINEKEPKYVYEYDSVEQWKEEERIITLKSNGMMDRNGNISPKLFKALKIRKNLKENVFSQVAPSLILWDIFRFYITKSKDMRKRQKGPFPYLRGDIDRQQREIFTKLNDEAIELLKTYNNENIIKIKDMDFILHKKFKLEENIKGVKMNTNSVALGSAVILLNSDIDISIIAKTFNLSEESINKELKNIKTIGKPRTKKSRDFLELIK
ncbi:MAG: DUF530 domain-containing protein [Methanobrevibacter sp.]|jgi:Zn-finger domain-containing protein|nr:DUF530 domain-containing protein [Methanobrevibacter sp.]